MFTNVHSLFLHAIKVFPALLAKCEFYQVFNLKDPIFIYSFVGNEYAGLGYIYGKVVADEECYYTAYNGTFVIDSCSL